MVRLHGGSEDAYLLNLYNSLARERADRRSKTGAPYIDHYKFLEIWVFVLIEPAIR